MPEPPGAPIAWFMAEVRVVDLDASARWYAAALGFRVVLEDRERGFLLLEAGEGAGTARIALKRGPGGGDRGAVRLVFRAADVDAERDRLAGLGVAASGPTGSPEGYREIRLADPDGTPIHLFSWAVRPV